MNSAVMKKKLVISLFSVFCWLVLPTFSIVTLAGLPLSVDGRELPSLAPILDKSMPAVVNIATSQDIQVAQNPLLSDPFFRHFYQLPRKQLKRQNTSLGSEIGRAHV